jgi:hypothetical protein
MAVHYYEASKRERVRIPKPGNNMASKDKGTDRKNFALG